MNKVKLLDNISPSSIDMMIPCFKPVTKKYKKGETIAIYGGGVPNSVAILSKGEAKLEVFNENGLVSLLEQYREGDVFGELFSLPLENFQYMAIAISDCTVIFLDYYHIVSPCHRACAHHSQLISNLFMMAAQRSQELSLHISILGQYTIRGKLLAYLKYIRTSSGASGDAAFTIPMSFVQLSEYLVTDRSSLMREITNMNREGIIESKNKEFRILQ